MIHAAGHDTSGIGSSDLDGPGARADTSGPLVANDVIVLLDDRFLEPAVDEQDASTDRTLEDHMALDARIQQLAAGLSGARTGVGSR